MVEGVEVLDLGWVDLSESQHSWPDITCHAHFLLCFVLLSWTIYIYLWYPPFLSSSHPTHPHLYIHRCTILSILSTVHLLWKLASKKFLSATGNRTPVSRVTGGDTSHYTIAEVKIKFGHDILEFPTSDLKSNALLSIQLQMPYGQSSRVEFIVLDILVYWIVKKCM